MNLNHNIPPEIFEEIESYLLQDMTAEEQQAFTQKLTGNTLLQEQVHQVRLTIIGIKEQALSESLNGFHKELPKAETATIKKIKKTPLQRWLVAASILLALSVGGLWLYNRSTPNEKLFATYFKPDPGLISAMSSTDNYVFDKAMIDYKTGSYQEAITAWQGLQKNDQQNDTLNYFIGVGFVALRNTKAALPYLQKVVAMPQSYFVKDAGWYLGLALIKEERLQEAIQILNDSEHPQKEQLLKELLNHTVEKNKQ